MRNLSIDVETTGLDLETDRIIELAISEWQPGFSATPIYFSRFNPMMSISPGATENHGITDADVENEPHFDERAQEIHELLFGARLVGYNLRRFDIPILDRELRAADMPGFDFERLREIDTLLAWWKLEPRTLEYAHRRFGGTSSKSEDFHGAEFDSVAAAEVADGMLAQFGLTVDDLEALSKDPDEVDRFGRFSRNEAGEIVFAFGKHRGEIASEHQNYLTWMQGADFHESVKEICRQLAYQPSMI